MHRQPITVEIDTGSASSRGQPPGQIWLVRLRRGEQTIITTIGLSRTGAEHLADHINDFLNEPQKSFDKT